MAAGALAGLAAGCGASSPAASTQSVAAGGFRFAAPSGWSVQRSRLAVTAQHGSELVQVSTFPLTKPYRAALYEKVGPELRGQPSLDGRADLLVQLMQFHRAAVTGGVEVEPTIQ